jgi:hypothetical protein
MTREVTALHLAQFLPRNDIGEHGKAESYISSYYERFLRN